MKTAGAMAPLLLIWMLLASPSQAQDSSPARLPDFTQLQAMAARFAPTPMRVDVSRLSPGDQQALVKLLQAAQVVDTIFLKQLWSGNPTMLAKLRKETTPLGKAQMHYFWLNKGPWGDLDDGRAFLAGAPAQKLPGANFYPEDMAKDDFERWLATLKPEQQEQAKSFFTVIRRKAPEKKPKGFLGPPEKFSESMRSVAYSEEYKEDLTRAADLLKQAAALTGNASLKKFLTLRAEAFLSNDYYASDVAWMDLDAPLDITIGPYETYNDEMFGYKAAFEAYINLRDDEETRKLAAFARHLQEIENSLPIEPRHRNSKLGAAAPIRVVDQILSAGDGAHGVQTAAYNLPNDDRVVQEKGSKRVLLKNVQEAKFRSTLAPIAKRMLPPNAMADVSFEYFFTHILAHELMHGLGPHQIKVDGRDTTAREELKELYSAIEEAKADVTGLFALQTMMDHAKEWNLGKTLASDEAAQRQLYVTYLASSFRTLRFGLNDAHGKGMAVQFNYFLDHGGFVAHPDGTYTVEMSKMKRAVRDLDHILLTLEAEGDYPGAKKLLDEMGVVRPALARSLAQLNDLPTDIAPENVTAQKLLAAASGASKTGR